MSTQTKPTSTEAVKKMIAVVCHELRPSVPLEEWEKHVNANIHDAKAFFAGNGEGLAEYESFVRTHDKDAYRRRLNLKTK